MIPLAWLCSVIFFNLVGSVGRMLGFAVAATEVTGLRNPGMRERHWKQARGLGTAFSWFDEMDHQKGSRLDFTLPCNGAPSAFFAVWSLQVSDLVGQDVSPSPG